MSPLLRSLGRADAPQPAGRKDPTIERSTGLSPSAYGRGYQAPNRSSDVERMIRDTFDRVTWVFRCVDAIANAQAERRVIARRGDRDNGEEIEHALLPLLNYKPNEHEHAYNFRYTISAQLELSTRGVFIETVRSRRGDLIELHLLPPGKTKPIPDASTFVSGYEVQIGATKFTLPADRVLWIKRPHPTDPYRSMTPAEAAGLTIDADWLARLYNAHFLQNDGRPGGLVGVKGRLMPKDADELRAYFSGGPSTAGSWRVVEADDINVADLALSPRDMQWRDGRASGKEEILIAYGTPESVIGNASGRTYDNADAEREVWWEGKMRPHNRLIGNGFDALDGDPDTFTVFDTSDVPVLQRAEERRRAELRNDVAAGLATPDEYRENIGEQPFGVPATQSLYMPISLLPYARRGSEEEQPPTRVPVTATPPAAIEAGETASRPPFDESKARAPSDTGDRYVNMRRAAGETMRRWEAIVDEMMRRFFARQQRIVVEKLGGTRARQGTRHWQPPGEKDIDVRRIFDSARWDRELRAEAEATLASLYREVGDEMVTRVMPTEDDFSFRLNDPGVQRALDARVTKIIGINSTTESLIRETLKEGEQLGESIEKLQRRVREVFSDASTLRARTIARTEVIGATNQAGYLGAAQTNRVKTKTWLATSDDRTRPEHLELDGTSVGFDEPFNTGLSEMLYPGDPDGDAGDVINCRCTLLFETEPSADEQPAAEQTEESSSGENADE